MSTHMGRTRRGAALKATKSDIWERNPTVTGIFVSFLRSVADAEATWYSLKPLGNETPYIGDILGLSSNNTFAYLKILGLCGERNGVYFIMKENLQSFCLGNMIQDFTQFNKFRNEESWIRIGTTDLQGIPVPALGVPAPRIPLLRKRQGKFLEGLRKALLPAGKEAKPGLSTIISSTINISKSVHAMPPSRSQILRPTQPAPAPGCEYWQRLL
jgi:hypothetical protein